jgi:hypothetical protein
MAETQVRNILLEYKWYSEALPSSFQARAYTRVSKSKPFQPNVERLIDLVRTEYILVFGFGYVNCLTTPAISKNDDEPTKCKKAIEFYNECYRAFKLGVPFDFQYSHPSLPIEIPNLMFEKLTMLIYNGDPVWNMPSAIDKTVTIWDMSNQIAAEWNLTSNKFTEFNSKQFEPHKLRHTGVLGKLNILVRVLALMEAYRTNLRFVIMRASTEYANNTQELSLMAVAIDIKQVYPVDIKTIALFLNIYENRYVNQEALTVLCNKMVTDVYLLIRDRIYLLAEIFAATLPLLSNTTKITGKLLSGIATQSRIEQPETREYAISINDIRQKYGYLTINIPISTEQLRVDDISLWELPEVIIETTEHTITTSTIDVEPVTDTILLTEDVPRIESEIPNVRSIPAESEIRVEQSKSITSTQITVDAPSYEPNTKDNNNNNNTTTVVNEEESHRTTAIFSSQTHHRDLWRYIKWPNVTEYLVENERDFGKWICDHTIAFTALSICARLIDLYGNKQDLSALLIGERLFYRSKRMAQPENPEQITMKYSAGIPELARSVVHTAQLSKDKGHSLSILNTVNAMELIATAVAVLREMLLEAELYGFRNDVRVSILTSLEGMKIEGFRVSYVDVYNFLIEFIQDCGSIVNAAFDSYVSPKDHNPVLVLAAIVMEQATNTYSMYKGLYIVNVAQFSPHTLYNITRDGERAVFTNPRYYRDNLGYLDSNHNYVLFKDIPLVTDKAHALEAPPSLIIPKYHQYEWPDLADVTRKLDEAATGNNEPGWLHAFIASSDIHYISLRIIASLVALVLDKDMWHVFASTVSQFYLSKVLGKLYTAIATNDDNQKGTVLSARNIIAWTGDGYVEDHDVLVTMQCFDKMLDALSKNPGENNYISNELTESHLLYTNSLEKASSTDPITDTMKRITKELALDAIKAMIANLSSVVHTLISETANMRDKVKADAARAYLLPLLMGLSGFVLYRGDAAVYSYSRDILNVHGYALVGLYRSFVHDILFPKYISYYKGINPQEDRGRKRTKLASIKRLRGPILDDTVAH